MGQQCYSINITAQPSHGGNPQMGMRRNAFTTTAQQILATEHQVIHFPNDLLATVGKLTLWPNAAKIISNCEELTFDMQEFSHGVIDHIQVCLETRVENISVAAGT